MNPVIVIPPMALQQLMTDIVTAVHGLATSQGDVFTASTLDPKALRQAAICAVAHATGLDIWPGDHIIEIDPPTIRHGIFEQRRR